MGVPTRLLEAARLQGAWENYVEYLKDPERQNTRINTQEARPAQVKVAVVPFDGNLDFTNQKVLAQSNEEAWQSYNAVTTGYAVEHLTGATYDVVKLGNFKAAKIVIKTLAGGKSVGTSARTKLKYLKYNGTSRGFAFGRKTETQTEEEGFLAIRGLISGTFSSEGLERIRFSRQRERV